MGRHPRALHQFVAEFAAQELLSEPTFQTLTKLSYWSPGRSVKKTTELEGIVTGILSLRGDIKVTALGPICRGFLVRAEGGSVVGRLLSYA